MTTNLSIEVMFSHSFQKYLKQKKEDLTHVITSSVLSTEDYATAVGSLRAFKDIEDRYNELMKEYFAR